MHKEGFTLTEVIISALILVLTAGCLLYLFSTEMVVSSGTAEKMQAINFARQTIERLRDEVGADTWPNAGDLDSGVRPDPITDGEGFSREYTVTDIGPPSVDYKSVTVKVEW